jgi:hypothetical protein
MRRIAVSAVLAALAGPAVGLALPAVAPAAKAETVVSIATFYEALAPYGQWLRHPRHGWVWTPAGVDQDWRPYTRGQWAWTAEHGWLWQSDEPFGWATYHYGRWDYEDGVGWYWVPGTVWGPAWVAWRASEDYVGWAPLPPEAEATSGTVYYDEGAYAHRPYWHRRWVFVGVRFLLLRHLHRVAMHWRHNPHHYARTRHATAYGWGPRGYVNRGIHPGHVQRWTGRPVPVVRVTLASHPTQVGYRRFGPGAGGTIAVYRPQVRAAPPGAAPPPTARRTYPGAWTPPGTGQPRTVPPPVSRAVPPPTLPFAPPTASGPGQPRTVPPPVARVIPSPTAPSQPPNVWPNRPPSPPTDPKARALPPGFPPNAPPSFRPGPYAPPPGMPQPPVVSRPMPPPVATRPMPPAPPPVTARPVGPPPVVSRPAPPPPAPVHRPPPPSNAKAPPPPACGAPGGPACPPAAGSPPPSTNAPAFGAGPGGPPPRRR